MSVVFSEVSPRIQNIAGLVRAEFHEMPGMCLTAWQVRRLWNLTQADCSEALAYLCETGSLVRDPAGRYLLRHFDN